MNEIDARFREEISRLVEKSQYRPTQVKVKKASSKRKGGLHRKEEQEYFSLRYTP